MYVFYRQQKLGLNLRSAKLPRNLASFYLATNVFLCYIQVVLIDVGICPANPGSASWGLFFRLVNFQTI